MNTQANQTEITRLPKEWPYRLIGILSILFLITLLSALTVTVKDKLVSKQINAWKEDFFSFTSKHGFLIDDIAVTGRDRTTLAEILQAVSLGRNDNILQADLEEVKSRVEKLPWVRSAIVKRSFFPNIIQISIEEKQIGAIWQNHEKFYPVDFDGNIIHADFRTQTPILLIVGEKAPENVKKLLEAIYDKDKKLYQRIKVANFISGRRWNLVLDDIEKGITIKLPEENPEEAWQKLLKLHASKGILKRKLTIIDLRLQDKVIVKLRKSPLEAANLNKGKEHKL